MHILEGLRGVHLTSHLLRSPKDTPQYPHEARNRQTRTFAATISPPEQTQHTVQVLYPFEWTFLASLRSRHSFSEHFSQHKCRQLWSNYLPDNILATAHPRGKSAQYFCILQSSPDGATGAALELSELTAVTPLDG